MAGKHPDPDEHEEMESLVVASVLDVLDRRQQAEVDAHLATCPRCRTLEASLRETAVEISAGLESAPPARLRVSVLDAVRAEAAASSPTEARMRPSRRAVIGSALALAASAVVATGVVVSRPGRSEEEREIARVLTAGDARLYSTTWESAQVTVVHSASSASSVIEVRGLPPAPRGRDYQIWSMSPAGPEDAGLLRPDGDGRARLLIGSGGAEGTAVSLEPAGGSEQPTTPPFIAVTYS